MSAGTKVFQRNIFQNNMFQTGSGSNPFGQKVM